MREPQEVLQGVDWEVEGYQLVDWELEGYQLVDWELEGYQLVDWELEGYQLVDWEVVVISSGVTAAPSTDQNRSLDPLTDAARDSDISNGQSGPDHSSLNSGLDQSLLSSVSGSSHSAAQGDAADASSPSQSEAHREQTGGADSPDPHGNGRQTVLNSTNAGLHTELTGATLGYDVTESPLAVLHTDSLDSASHGYSHTELVSMATDSTWTVTNPTGTAFDSSHPAVTNHTQMAGPTTEQYNPSGQGPEGTENVELEDTC
ncbi:uncharacterized protein si:ch211-80h18.1 [Pseudoliparis swirei]|uniref:uncharacterized protein si:ch211-80h18.1 n=1 Tax=Pseudoliparis swirei TaxID=2059687 RepID=UPI0024BDECA5|nr:uncharacterized protein si:ch211-80h18.1 [Pseudoliparis swirei]